MMTRFGVAGALVLGLLVVGCGSGAPPSIWKQHRPAPSSFPVSSVSVDIGRDVRPNQAQWLRKFASVPLNDQLRNALREAWQTGAGPRVEITITYYDGAARFASVTTVRTWTRVLGADQQVLDQFETQAVVDDGAYSGAQAVFGKLMPMIMSRVESTPGARGAAPGARTGSPTTANSFADRLRAHLDTVALRILACTGTKAVAIKASWGPGAPVHIQIQGKKRSAMQNECVKGAVGPFPAPSNVPPGKLLHAVAR